MSAISPSVTDNLNFSYISFIQGSSTPVILDALSDQNSLFLQHLLLPFSIPILRHGMIDSLTPVAGYRVWVHLSRLISPQFSRERTRSVQSASEKFAENFLTASPDSLHIYTALVQLAKKFGWNQMACILGDDSSVRNLNGDRIFTVEGSGLKLVLLLTLTLYTCMVTYFLRLIHQNLSILKPLCA